MSTTLFMQNGFPEAVLFDLDGTLADTAPDLGNAANRLREEAGLSPLPLAAIQGCVSSGVGGILFAAFGVTPAHPNYPSLSDRFLDLYSEGICVETRLFDEIAELLETLERTGIKWGIVTNKRGRFTTPLVSALRLHQRACCVISGDSAQRPKPAPDPLLLACRLSSVTPNRCVYVGDDLRDIQAGKAAGMQTVAAAYGYLGENPDIESWQADAVIQRPLELMALVGL